MADYEDIERPMPEGRGEATIPAENPVAELTRNLVRVFRSELRLAAVELKHAASDVRSSSRALVGGGVAALLGVFPLMAFLVIGLGRLLGDNYWLSALIIGGAMVIGGGLVAYLAVRSMSFEKLALPRTRDTLQQDGELVGRKVRELGTAVRQDLGNVTQLHARRTS